MLLWQVEELLRQRHVPVEVAGVDGYTRWLKIDVPQAEITVESRPVYCDRGNFIVKVFPRGDLALSLDEHDGFPRYYFGPLACADEIFAWMQCRHLLDDALVSWWAVARDITDETLGPGAYADANRGHPDPRVQEQVEISDQNRPADE